MRWQMVGIAWIYLSLVACSTIHQNTEKPVFGKEVEAPYGWKYTYCPSHRDELGCNDVQ